MQRVRMLPPPAPPRDAVETRVWVNGERFSTYYLLDARDGLLPRAFELAENVPTAGFGQWCGRDFVAIFSDPLEAGVSLWVGGTRHPVDGMTRIEQRDRLLRTVSVARISRPGSDPRTVRQWTPHRLLRGLLDLTYDELDDDDENHLRQVAHVVTRADHADFRRRHPHAAGPWHLLDHPGPS